MDSKMEEITSSLMDAQIVTFPSEMFASNRLMFTTDGTTILGAEGLTMGDVGLSYVSIPVQIIQEPPIQQQVLTAEVAPETTTIYIDQSQLAYLSNGQVLITEEGLLATVGEQHTIDKDSLFFTPTSTITESVLKPISKDNLTLAGGGLNTLDLSCLAATEDLLLESSADLDQRLASPTEHQLPASPGGEELVISGTDVSWVQQQQQQQPPLTTATTATTTTTTSNNSSSPAPTQAKDNSKDIPPPLRKGPFKCEICYKEFPLYSKYRKHSQFHLEDKPHKCPACSASFNILTNLILHKATHQVDRLECPECLKRFSRVASLKAHIMLHEREESLFCTECGDEFGNQVQLDKHMRSHDEEWVKPHARVYQCPNCDKLYSRASVLRQHMKDHFKVKAALSANSYNRAVRRGRLLHSCVECGKSFQKPSQLIRHNRIHTGEKPFKCDLCTRSFNQKGSLLIHMMSKHKGMRPYQCQFCNAAFSQKGNLRAHVVRLHSIPNTQETVYQCSECSCVFRKLGSLNAHVNRMHLPTNQTSMEITSQEINQLAVKTQRFSLASKDTSDKENDVQDEKETMSHRVITISNKLEDGSVKHTTMKQRQIGSVKWHQCTYCGKEFKKPSDLVRHTRIHTQEKPYKCKLCQRGFTVRSTMVNHMRTHSNSATKEFKCATCNKIFASASLLRLHKKSQHNSKARRAKGSVPGGGAGEGEIDEAAQGAGGESSQQQSHQQESQQQNDTDGGISIEEAASALPPEYQQPLVITDQGVMQFLTVKQVWSGSDRPHRCMICGQSYRKSNHLKVHLRTHSGERPFMCSLCSRAFTSAGVLKGHMRTHTMLKTHRCNECGKYLSTKGSLRRHAETHALGNSYLCPYCDRTYKTHGACRKHMKNHKIILTEVTEEEDQEVVQLEDQGVEQDGGETETEPVESKAEADVVHEASESIVQQQDLIAKVQRAIPSIEALIVNTHDSNTPLVISRVEGVGEGGISHTLHADANGTITLPNLTGQDTLTQESIREIEESLNQQLFCTTDLTGLDKEQVVLFDQGFESCVFPSITLQGEHLELGQALTSANLASILPTSDKDPKTLSCADCGAELKTEHDIKTHRLSCLPDNIQDEPRTITIGNTTIHLEEDIAAANLPSTESDHDSEYRCDICSFLAQSGEELARHRISHISCDICEKSFSTAAQYKAHIKSHGREKEFVCEHCGSTFTQLSSLARHMAIHNPDERKCACMLCDVECRNESQLRRHITSAHAGEGAQGGGRPRRKRGEVRQLTDEEAQALAAQEATSMSERVLKASLAERDRISDVKDPDTYRNEPVHANQCKYCPKSFRKPSDLVRHLRIHTGERPYQCDYCSKCFTVKSTLDSHLKTHNIQKRCVCHVCGYYFATKGSLKVHMRLHTGSRPFRCPVCFQRFRTSGHRKAHLMLHIREAQPQLVALTVQQASQQQDTEVHNVQEEVREDSSVEVPAGATVLASLPQITQYQCSVCEKMFSKQSYLVRHMRIHTGEKPFQCKECGKSFSQKNSLDTHLRIHKGDKQWSCAECPRKFSQKCNLDAHVKRFHTPAHTISAPSTPFTIDLGEERLPMDWEKVVSDLFPHMKPTKTTITADEL